MEILTHEAGVMLALARGPSSGVRIMESLSSITGGRSPGPGTLYPLVRRLEKAGLIRSWIERDRSRVGRPRRFLELTFRGVAAINRMRYTLREIIGERNEVTVRTPSARRMRNNLRRAFRVSSFAMRLRDGARDE